MQPGTDSRVDEYIEAAEPFARPILERVRRLVHEADPAVQEAIKWGMPWFVHGGQNLCWMAAFKAHAAVGFWHHGMRAVLGRAKGGEKDEDKDGMGAFGRITSAANLPGDAELRRHVKRAVALIEAGVPARGEAKTKARPPLREPEDLTSALGKNRAALAQWQDFSPSKRRDYVEWVTEAKRDETRKIRIETAVGWIAEGKGRNWKYEKG